jgi:hypothetical protein
VLRTDARVVAAPIAISAGVTPGNVSRTCSTGSVFAIHLPPAIAATTSCVSDAFLASGRGLGRPPPASRDARDLLIAPTGG